MGLLHQRVTISEISGERTTNVCMLVDTGATYSVIPKALAQTVGITATRSFVMTVADGRRLKVTGGVAMFRIGRREAPSTILVGNVPEPILGVETLEVLGLAVDPRRRRLSATRPYTYRLTGFR